MANDCSSVHPISQPGPFKQQQGDKQLQPTGDKNPGRVEEREKGFLLTQSRYCTSLHKRALGEEQLTCSCHAQCTAPSHCVCICVVGQYLGRRTLLLGSFRLGNKCFGRYLLVNQGQFILVKFLTVQMYNQNHKCKYKYTLIQQNDSPLVSVLFHLWTRLNM